MSKSESQMRSKFEVGGHLEPSVGLEIMQVHRLGVRAQEGDIRTWRVARGKQIQGVIQGQLGWGWAMPQGGHLCSSLSWRWARRVARMVGRGLRQ